MRLSPFVCLSVLHRLYEYAFILLIIANFLTATQVALYRYDPPANNFIQVKCYQ